MMPVQRLAARALARGPSCGGARRAASSLTGRSSSSASGAVALAAAPRRAGCGAVARAQRGQVVRGGHGGLPPPPFMRLPAPNKELPEEWDLLWDDGVAPELCIDFEAQNYSTMEALGVLSVMLGALGGLAAYIKYVRKPEEIKPYAEKEWPYDGLTREMGGHTDSYSTLPRVPGS